jgi:hypothetical protein
MRYAKWVIYFEPNSNEGTTPAEILESRGGWLKGKFHLSTFEVVGYVSGGVDLSGLENYQIQELTASEALTLAQTINADCTIKDNGELVFPKTTDHQQV